MKSVSLTLSKAYAIDQRHLGNICSKAQLATELCAGRQAIGEAWVKTPLLDQPLSGPAYAVSGFGKLPRLTIILDGQVRILPQGKSTSVNGGFLKTVVPMVPDAPIGHFRLKIYGGKRGYLTNTRDTCRFRPVTKISFTAHSGKRTSARVPVKTPCTKRKAGKRLSGQR